MHSVRIFILSFLVISTVCFAMGDKPTPKLPEERYVVRCLYPLNNAAALTDGKTDTTVAYNQALLDLNALKYIKEISVMQQTTPNVSYSVDIINWHELPVTRSIYGWTAAVNSEVLRYIRVSNSTTANCAEIFVVPFTDYKLSFSFIDAVPSSSQCEVVVDSNMPVYAQVLFGMNYDFIYNRKLTDASASASFGRKQKLRMTGLKPETTYRYQVVLIDFNGNELRSNYFTVTTLPIENADNKGSK